MMRTNTDQFRNSHGKAPKGYGTWAFEITGTDGRGAYTTETYFITGKMSDARKQAIKRMKSDIGAIKEITEIVVLP